MTLWRIFYTFVMAGLSAVGGAQGTIVAAHDSWVATGLVPADAFGWAVSLGQLTPGPVSVLVYAIGWLIRGPVGAVVAVLGVTLPTIVACTLAARLLRRYRSAISPYMRGVPWVVVGLALAACIKLAVPLHPGVLEFAGIAIAAVLSATGKAEAYWIIAGGALLGVVQLLLR